MVLVKVKLAPIMINPSRGRASFLLLLSIATILIRVKSAISSTDAGTGITVSDVEVNIQRSTVPTTNQLYDLGNTPINIQKIYLHTKNYWDNLLLREDFLIGFRLQYSGPRLPRFSRNLPSLGINKQVAEEKIQKEVSLGRVAGPFSQPPFPTLQVSSLGLVPKKDGDYRLIHHLSYPENASINYFIDSEQSSVKYSTIDAAAAIIAKLGRGNYLAKTDIKSAFRLLPVNNSAFDLLGFQFNHAF